MYRKLKSENLEIYSGDLGVYRRIVLQCIIEKNGMGWFHLAREYVRRPTLTITAIKFLAPWHGGKPAERLHGQSRLAASCYLVLKNMSIIKDPGICVDVLRNTTDNFTVTSVKTILWSHDGLREAKSSAIICCLWWRNAEARHPQTSLGLRR
jgi:hypothetical protein